MKRYFKTSLLFLLCICLSWTLNAADTDKTSTGKPEATSAKGIDAKKEPDKAAAKVAQKQSLGFFHSINLYGVGDLYITQGDEADFTIEAEPKIQELINAYVKDQVLYIEMKNASDHSQAKVNYYLKLKTLQAITTYAASSVYIKDGFETKVLSISLLSGFGEAHLNVDVTKLTTKISGAGKVEIQGIADEQEISISGIGEFLGNNLKSKVATVKISGSGVAKINVSEDLAVKLAGDGQVQYCGKPNITKEIEGKGTISPLDVSECK